MPKFSKKKIDIVDIAISLVLKTSNKNIKKLMIIDALGLWTQFSAPKGLRVPFI